MTVTLSKPAKNVTDIYNAALASKQSKIDNHKMDMSHGDWSDSDGAKLFLEALESITIEIRSENVVLAKMKKHANVWSYVCAEILDVETTEEIWKSSHIVDDDTNGEYWRIIINCLCGNHNG